MRSFLKKLIAYFRTVEIFESNNSFLFNLSDRYEFKIYKKFSNIKSKEILSYFKIHKNKKKRFKNKCFFLTLRFNQNLVSSGWLYRGKKWKITEINYVLNILNKFVLFDFITPPKFRNKGNYTKLLKLIRYKFKDKNIMIYALSSNKKSKKAIIKAGFKFKRKLRKLF